MEIIPWTIPPLLFEQNIMLQKSNVDSSETERRDQAKDSTCTEVSHKR